MSKKRKIRGYISGDKQVMFPKSLSIPTEYEDEQFLAKLTISVAQEWVKADKQLNKYKEFVDVILNHMTNNGWSNDFTIDFWTMDEKELKIVNKMFEKKSKEKSE